MKLDRQHSLSELRPTLGVKSKSSKTETRESPHKSGGVTKQNQENSGIKPPYFGSLQEDSRIGSSVNLEELS